MASNFTNNVISAIDIKNTKYNIRAIPFHATEAEWNSINYIPKQGEFIVYDADNNNTSPRFKTGDGVTDVKNLPFTLATISEVQTYVNSQIGSAGHLKRVVLEDDAELPEVSEADVDTIYMKKNSESRLISDVFEEYMVINGAWEIIGNTRVDLSNYTTQEMVEEKIETAISEIPQNDWNAKEGEPGHVLNRTHYIEKESVEILSQKTLDAFAGYDTIWDAGSIEIVPGKMYSVLWNGVEYEVESKSMDDAVVVLENNVFQITKSYDPSAASEADKWFIIVTPKDGSTEVILSIYQYTETVHTLDPKYLPDGVPYCIEGNMVEVLPGFSVTVTEENDGFFFITEPFSVTIGESYTVNWNGTEYKVTAADSAILNEEMAGVPLLMNEGVDFNTGSGLVFAIVCMGSDDTYGQVIVGDGSTSVTLSIYQGGAEVRKLDGRCLPSGVPYIEGEGTIKTVLAETTFTGLSNNGTQIGLIPLIAEKTYFVNWNGTKYTCVSRNVNGAVVIGNGSYLLGTGNDEPFGVASLASDGISMIWSHDGSTEAIVSIEQDETVFHKIDERLLPENVDTTYTLTKDGSTIKLVGSDGSETSIEDSNTTYTLDSFGIKVGANVINTIHKLPGKKVEGDTFSIDGNDIVALSGAEIFNAYGSNKATGDYSHAEGCYTTASGDKSHAEGYYTTASGVYSHAEGDNTTASGGSSHAEGYHTIASKIYQHVQGKYNVEDIYGNYAHIVGNGDSTARSNAHTLGWDGNAWFAGDIYVGSTSGTNKDKGSKKLVAAPTDAVAGDLLMYDGTNWVKLSKADLIAEIIAALPSAEEASF